MNAILLKELCSEKVNESSDGRKNTGISGMYAAQGGRSMPGLFRPGHAPFEMTADIVGSAIFFMAFSEQRFDVYEPSITHTRGALSSGEG